MKKIFLTTSIILFAFVTYAQKIADYNISKADVYLSGAKVYSQSEVELETGVHTILIKNITNELVAGTIQAKISEGASLVAITPSRNYIEPGELSSNGKELFEKQEELTQKIHLLRIDQETLKEEGKLIISMINKQTTNEKKPNYDVTELQDITKFYATRMGEIKKASYTIELEIKKAQDELRMINAQLSEDEQVKYKNLQQVEVVVNVTEAGSKTIELSYFVTNCGWKPYYDIKAEGKEKPIEIIYKASVWQSTGVDWEETEVILMSNQPTKDQNRPILNPLYVNSYLVSSANTFQQAEFLDYTYEEIADEVVYSNMLELSMDKKSSGSSIVQNIVYSTDINVTYEIAGKQSITGNGKGQLLTMTSKQVPAHFVYHSVPKLNEEVYLLAYIADWGNLNLINGYASIYLQDAYIGNITINEHFTGEEYPLSFGSDNRISVKRNKNLDLSSETKVGSEKKEKISYEFVLKNNLSTDIEVEILDQIPVSKNKNVKVILEEKGDAEYTENIGLLKWNVPVAKGKSNSVKFIYEIRYPKDSYIQYSAY